MEIPTSLPGSAVSSARGAVPEISSLSQSTAGDATKDQRVSMRGRKKHKCSVCGNIARSRCPFHACKGCCVKARNPCYIHVFKANPPGEPPQASSTADPPRQPVPSTVVRHPYDSLRLKTAKPSGHITRKEASFINAWRFQKLKDHLEGKVAAEDEAFDRYMQNVSLLEEAFALNAEPPEGLSPEGHLLIESGTGNEQADGGVDAAMLCAGLRVRLRSSSKRKEAHKQKLRRAIDRSLQKLHRGERGDAMLENEDIYMGFVGGRSEMKRKKVQSKEGKERLRRMDLFNALFEKVKQIENQDDLNLCLKMYEENFMNGEFRDFFHSGGLVEPDKETGHSNVLGLPVEDTSEHQKTSGTVSRESLKESLAETGEESISSLSFCTAYDARVDSRGVSKGWWKANMNQEIFDPYMLLTSADLSAL